ncbi:MAG: XdhC family protein [Acidimicrobiales bacterium]
MSASSRRIAARVGELGQQRRAFVLATVVRAQCPTSARPGDAAIIFPDGSVERFVGGQCAEGSVRVAALDVLTDGEAMLLRVLPEDGEEFPESPGARTVVNPCLSGGALEIYLEPKLPAPVLSVFGNTPIAAALGDFAPMLGFSQGSPDGAVAVIIASHGRGEQEAIRDALDAGVGFIGLVASAARGAAVLDELELSDDELARLHAPVGLAIGARTAEEIALSILADVVRAVRVDGLQAPTATPASALPSGWPSTAVDPVCSMTVAVDGETPHLTHLGIDYWFCNSGCLSRYREEIAA